MFAVVGKQERSNHIVAWAEEMRSALKELRALKLCF